jgi:hypothetical protein
MPEKNANTRAAQGTFEPQPDAVVIGLGSGKFNVPPRRFYLGAHNELLQFAPVAFEKVRDLDLWAFLN